MTSVTPPPCSWCPEPATDQIYAGTNMTGFKPVRHYLWLCEVCARAAREEREESMRDE